MPNLFVIVSKKTHKQTRSIKFKAFQQQQSSQSTSHQIYGFFYFFMVFDLIWRFRVEMWKRQKTQMWQKKTFFWHKIWNLFFCGQINFGPWKTNTFPFWCETWINGFKGSIRSWNIESWVRSYDKYLSFLFLQFGGDLLALRATRLRFKPCYKWLN